MLGGKAMGRVRERGIYQWLAFRIDIWTMEGVAGYYLDIFGQMFLKSHQLRGFAGGLAANDRADLGCFSLSDRRALVIEGKTNWYMMDACLHGPYRATTLSMTPASTL